MFKLKLFRLFFVGAIFLFGLFSLRAPAQAQSVADGLAKEIDDFFAVGAQGYLVWQYSGNKGNGQIFASDPYAFFQGTPDGEAICKVLQQKAAENPGKFLGVNMWDAGGTAHSPEKIKAHLQWLNTSCGTTVVRIFAKAGGPGGVEKVLNAAEGTGVKILVAVGDYSNGSPGLPSKVGSEWFPQTLQAFTSRNTGNEFYAQAAGVAALKNHPAYWGTEVANEIHCRGDDAILEDYKNLGEAFARLFGRQVGYGQKASENTTKCDSPGVQFEGQSHFQYTNSPSNITISSAHYYNPAEKALSIEAAKQAVQQGKLFYIGEAPPKLNADGTDPTKNINYQTIPYDFDQFYIHPIKGINPSNKDIIRDDLVKQGYEARCAGPGFDIILDQNGADAMKKFLDVRNSPGGNGGVLGGNSIGKFTGTYGPNPIGDRVVSLLTVDYRKSLVPVLRDANRLPQLKRSLEDFYGHGQTNSPTYSEAELKSGAINSLLTNNQRCVQSALSLYQRQEMCNKLEDPSACALYATEVPDSGLTVEELLKQFKGYSSGSKDFENVCTKLLAGENTPLRRGMLHLPLQIDNAYRLAFLVTTIRTIVPNRRSMMNLFQHPRRGPLGEGPDPKHVVLVTAFKVPDILTNKGTVENEPFSGHTPFNDPGMLTRDVLIPSKIKQQLEKDGNAERKQLLDMGRYVASIPQDDQTMEIECQLSGIGGQQCLDPLSWALVDIINAQSLIEKQNEDINDDRLTATQKEQLFKLDCDSGFETVDYILDPGKLDPRSDAGRIFKKDWGVAILENLFTDDTHMPSANAPLDPTYSDTNNSKVSDFHWGLKSIFHVVDGNEGAFGNSEEGRTVRQFIVYPTGYDLKTVEAVVSGTFFSSNQIEALREKSKKYEYLEMKDGSVVFTGGEISHSFEDKTDCKTKYRTAPDGSQVPYEECPTKSFGFRLDTSEEPKPTGVLGAKLGYWTHTIQQQLQKAAALTHKYLENCDSTEDFLLDACGGVAVAQVATGANIAADLTNVSSFQIQYWNGSTVVFQPPSQELWNAIMAAAQKHGCDPFLVLATAHSESQSYTNHTTPNAAGALGVFQFTGSWNLWWKPNASGVRQCMLHQPPTFTREGFDYSSATNIPAAADAACRLLLWTGAQRYPDNKADFIRAFSQRGDNQYGQIWNAHAPQAEYVWRLWGELVKRANKTAVPAPAGYPYPSCINP
jgi:hypothetical protein